MILSKHTLNEEKQRLEPISTECAFCSKGIVTDIEHCHYLPLYKEKGRFNIIVYRDVEFNIIDMGLPRCQSCFNIHEKANYDAQKIRFIAIVALILFNLCFRNFFLIIFSFIFILPLFISIKKYMESHFIWKMYILSPEKVIRTDESIKDFKLMGWSIDQPEV